MTNLSNKSAARAAARRLQEEASAERVRREQMNIEDLATFLVATNRLSAVDEWAADRLAQVRAEANVRREEHRAAAGQALQAIRGRGEAVAAIAHLTSLSASEVRAYLRAAALTKRTQ